MFGFKQFFQEKGLVDPLNETEDDDDGSFQNLGDDGQTFWAGEGGGASGVLPICQKTGRICFAWRSYRVHQGDCWGTFGGALKRGYSPEQNAKEELHEETGYNGSVKMIPAFVFKSGKFIYYNYIGIVDFEFPFAPLSGHSWETDEIRWFSYSEALQEIATGNCHPGLVALFNSSSNIIKQYANPSKENKVQGNLF